MDLRVESGEVPWASGQSLVVPLIPDRNGLGSAYRAVRTLLIKDLSGVEDQLDRLRPSQMLIYRTEWLAPKSGLILVMDDPCRDFPWRALELWVAAHKLLIATLVVPIWGTGSTTHKMAKNLVAAAKVFDQRYPRSRLRKVVLLPRTPEQGALLQQALANR